MRSPQEAGSLCNSCPRLCRFSCPVSTVERDESTTPWGKMSAMKLAESGKIPFDSKCASLAYKCLTCRASEEVCELDNPVPESLIHYRGRAFREGVAPLAVTQFVKRFQKQNNPYGVDLLSVLKRIEPEREGVRPGRRVYYAGCTEIRYYPETIRKTLRVFRKSGIDLGLYLDPLVCCGYPLYLAGDQENFRELAEINAQRLKRFSEIWSSSPQCLYTLETVYRKEGFPLSARFHHIAEKLVPLLGASGKRKQRPRNREDAIAYHDPCYLGRYRHLYDPPREIIRRLTGQPPRELWFNRERSVCCGGGGLLPVSSPATASKITIGRLEEFRRTGASTLVSGCPVCIRQLQEVDPKADVIGLIDLVEER